MSDVNRLRGAIYAKYKNMAAFAEAIGWSPQRLSLAIKHPETISVQTADMMLEKLGMKDDPTAIRIFLPSDSSKG